MPDASRARCEDCGLTYDVGRADVPVTEMAFTCDDCGGYVDVIDPQVDHTGGDDG